ncbi:hypothetical protein [Acinetobacter nosocomialis]|uniref:hypothetical protein n=1 Tax=Acinetobacter nosocomialis TaxID=106654 RepID=UPI001F2363E1|nr:hypothetical protein [Acinetobacter nosocomialis]
MSTTEIKTLIPLIAPFLTVFLGILAIPVIEVIKNYIERKRLLKALLEELKDEVKSIKNEYEDVFPCYMNALSKKNGDQSKKFDTITPLNIVLFSEEKLLNNHFQNLAPEIRQSLKNIKLLIDPINITIEKFHDLYHEALQDGDKDNPNLQRLIDLLNGYLCNVLALRYHANYLIDFLLKKSSTLKIYYEIDFDDSIRHQLKDMDNLNHFYFLRGY